ncbi:MAG TPA: BatA domain-containing protein [Archangium sp.]|jgi:hypothetical protein
MSFGFPWGLLALGALVPLVAAYFLRRKQKPVVVSALFLIGLSVLSATACSAPRPNPYVVNPKPGETLTSVPGPMPDFGSFSRVSDAILAACPVILRQPHALIPVPRTHQEFSVYWKTASEYCAWLYSADGEHVEMSLLATSPIQDDPSRRRCDLPAHVMDRRYPESAVAYLVMLHNHPGGGSISFPDLYAIAAMARIHGPTTLFHGHQVSISIAAFFGRQRDGKPECAGFYHYVPARSDEVVRYTIDNGRMERKVVARVVWSGEGDPKILSIEERP